MSNKPNSAANASPTGRRDAPDPSGMSFSQAVQNQSKNVSQEIFNTDEEVLFEQFYPEDEENGYKAGSMRPSKVSTSKKKTKVSKNQKPANPLTPH